MNFELRFNTDGDDFADFGAAEVVRILRTLQNDVLTGDIAGPIYDTDDRVIGSWSMELPQQRSSSAR